MISIALGSRRHPLVLYATFFEIPETSLTLRTSKMAGTYRRALDAFPCLTGSWALPARRSHGGSRTGREATRSHLRAVWMKKEDAVPQESTEQSIVQSRMGDVPRWEDDAFVVAPCSGKLVFDSEIARPGALVYRGSVVGHVIQHRGAAPIVSRFSGTVKRPLVQDGSRVRTRQPLVWLRRDTAA